MYNITAAEAVDREFGYIETKGEDLRHRHHHRHHHHQHHPSIPQATTTTRVLVKFEARRSLYKQACTKSGQSCMPEHLSMTVIDLP